MHIQTFASPADFFNAVLGPRLPTYAAHVHAWRMHQRRLALDAADVRLKKATDQIIAMIRQTQRPRQLGECE